jgi:addiction module HigA family antidote
MSTEHINSFAETLKEILEELSITQKEVALATGISPSHLTEMKQGKRRVTPENDLRLSRYFSTTEGFWLRLQTNSDLRKARAESGASIKREVPMLRIA